MIKKVRSRELFKDRTVNYTTWYFLKLPTWKVVDVYITDPTNL
ncbi:hypothetical protein SAMN05216524_104446 [Mucilaginibacter sp. OK098]|nr:hypothetical protein SAMN05216524_104446 [Mucilaginibacter sp. OK098]